MESAKIILLMTFVLSGLLLVGLSMPLILGRVPPNSTYGFRVKRTLSDPKIWYPANRYAGRWMAGAGIGLVVAAVALYAVPGLTFVRYALACLAIELIALSIGVARSFQYLRQFGR